MATYNLEEQEKIDGLKAWWESYGTIITIILFTIVAYFAGTQGWNYYQQKQRIQAADLYVLLQQVQQTEEVKKINDAVHLLLEGHPSSGYAPRAAMIAARANVDNDDVKTAKYHLQWIVDNATEEALRDLARLRLASLLLDEEKYDDALMLLGARDGDAFGGLYSDLKGDIYLAMGKNSDAQLAYQHAINMLGMTGNYFNIVQMKLDAIGEVSE